MALAPDLSPPDYKFRLYMLFLSEYVLKMRTRMIHHQIFGLLKFEFSDFKVSNLPAWKKSTDFE